MHFEFLNAGIGREQYEDKLNHYFKYYEINNGKYEKNISNIFNILIEHGDMNQAIKHAKKLDELSCDNGPPAKRKPATKVYELVEELLEYLGEPII